MFAFTQSQIDAIKTDADAGDYHLAYEHIYRNCQRKIEYCIRDI